MPTGDIIPYADMVEPLTAIAMSAAGVIARAHGRGGIRTKSDGSPVTVADEAAETVIYEGLTRLAPALPIISEERAAASGGAIEGTPYFLVDPLDGTREFIAGRNEYTVNIALVADGAPILGIIAAPALGTIWRGIVGRGTERLTFSGGGASPPIPIRARTRPAGGLIVVVSRSHLDDRTKAYLDDLAPTQRIACGSSMKFCRLAEGAADHYPRLSPTHDWDVAAGHAILAAAGGSVVQPDGTGLHYGTPALRIPAFLAWGDRRSK